MRKRVKLLIEGGCTELNPNKAEFPSNCSKFPWSRWLQSPARGSTHTFPLPLRTGPGHTLMTLSWSGSQAHFLFLLGHPISYLLQRERNWGTGGYLRKKSCLWVNRIWVSVSVFSCCYTKLPQTQWLKTRKIYSSADQKSKIGSQEAKLIVLGAAFLPEVLGENLFLPFPNFQSCLTLISASISAFHSLTLVLLPPTYKEPCDYTRPLR